MHMMTIQHTLAVLFKIYIIYRRTFRYVNNTNYKVKYFIEADDNLL